MERRVERKQIKKAGRGHRRERKKCMEGCIEEDKRDIGERKGGEKGEGEERKEWRDAWKERVK